MIFTLLNSNPMRPALLAILIFEVVAYGLSVPVMIFVSNLNGALSGLFGGGAALMALAAAALMRRPAGYLVGWTTQLVGILLGLLTPAMYVVGVMFAGLWTLTFVLGKRLQARTG